MLEFTDSEYDSYSESNNEVHHIDLQFKEVEANINEIFEKKKEEILLLERKLKEKAQELEEYKRKQEHKFSLHREKLYQNIEMANKLSKVNSIIQIECEGNLIATKYSTLRSWEESNLAKYFKDLNKCPMSSKGRFIVDRPFEAFKAVINYLRTGKVPFFRTESENMDFQNEIKYWNIPLINNKMLESSFKNRFDPRWTCESLRISSSKQCIEKSQKNHGMTFCTTALTEENPFIEFCVVM